MAGAFLGAKAAWDKALTKTNDPTIDDAIASFEYLKFESVSGNIAWILEKDIKLYNIFHMVRLKMLMVNTN